MAESLLTVSGVRKAFRRNAVLRGASMAMAPGELVGIVGENGSGKSTLLEILVGRLGRDAGELTLRGRLGYCPQKSLVFERLTVRENFDYFATAYDLRDWRPHMEALLERYRFTRYADHLVSEVSGGTRQKLNLALALLCRPTLVVLDEPYSGFDWETYLAFWEHATQLRSEGCGLLIVSHFLQDRSRFDRIYTLRDGVLSCDWRFWWTSCRMTAREVLRGRLVLLLLLLIPSLFYAVAWLTGTDTEVAFQLGSINEDLLVTVTQKEQMAVFIGLAATGLLTSFIGLKLIQREADVNQRLILCGYRAAELVAAKLAVLFVVISLVSVYVAAVLPALFMEVDRFGALVAAFAAGGWVYGCYGLLVGAIIRRELEGILFVALLTNIDAGWLQNPIWYAEAQNKAIITNLPAHLPSQASMAAAFTDEPIAGPLIGAFLYGSVLLVCAALVFAWRTRSR